jgi:DNA-binding NarL/FixJ family response regulator
VGKQIRTVIADQNEERQLAMLTLLRQQSHIQVVGTASDGPGAAEICYETWPDVVVLNLSLPVVDGVKTTQSILDHNAQTAVLIIANVEGDAYALEALKMGAKGYLHHLQLPLELVAAITALYQGQHYLPPHLAALKTAHTPNKDLKNDADADNA